MSIQDLTIVVCCNKNDLFFARICVASIRYYYPDIDIEIIKDYGNGYFVSNDIEKYFKVKVVDLGVNKFGWSGAKFHYLYKMEAGKKILMLDADIVFVGPFLERLMTKVAVNDYVVSIETEANPYADWVQDVYFDTRKIEANFSDYNYPGYFFNAGQIFLTIGTIRKEILDIYFDPHKYPFWKQPDLFPLVDQSVYNYLLPSLAAKNQLKLGTDSFFLWSKSKDASKISIKEIEEGVSDVGVIHWAGDNKNAWLSGMSRSDILKFFEAFYYNKVSFGTYNKIHHKIKYSLNNIFNKFHGITITKAVKKLQIR